MPPLSARITFINGNVLSTKAFSWSIAQINFSDPAGNDRACKPEQIASIQVLGGRVIWLSELDPVKEEQSTVLGTKWPTQLNLNAVGGPLKVARQTFARGIGVHTRSLLAYELDGSFTLLSLRAGMDDSAAPYGQARVAIVLDGKTLWQATMKAGEISPPLQLNITNGHSLELRAEPAEKMDVLGRVDWVDIALLRP